VKLNAQMGQCALKSLEREKEQFFPALFLFVLLDEILFPATT